MKVIKKQLVATVAQKLNLTEREADAVFEAVIGAIAEAVKRGDEVFLREFIRLSPAVRAAQIRTHPKTGQKIAAPAKPFVKARCPLKTE